MIRYTTLEKLRCAIRFRASMKNVTRQDDADINAAINRSLQRFREAICASGEPYYLQRADVTLPSGATSGLPYRTVSTSTFDPVSLRVYGVELVKNDVTITLAPVSFSARNDYHQLETDRATPIAWTHLDAETIAVMPAPDQDYPARIWYLPPHDDVTRDQDRIEVFAGGDDWLILEGTVQLLQRDAKPEVLTVLMSERDRILSEIMVHMRSPQSAGPILMRDTRGFRRRQRWNARYTR